MKKILCFIVTFCVILSLPCVAAMESVGTQIEYGDEGISVTFQSDSKLTEIEKKEIADKIVYGTQESEIMPASLLCSILGHDTSTETVSVIYHKVRATSPRCRKDVLKVEKCSRCDYENSTVSSSKYISCCPED